LLSLLSASSGKKIVASQLGAHTLQSQYTQPFNQVYDSSLASCKQFALLFSNTCDPTLPATSYDLIPTVNKTCTNVGYCPSKTVPLGINVGNTASCTFERKMCVTCSVGSDSLTYIRVQSNLMPDFCYHNGAFAPSYAWTIDYSVPFN
jgi:hypothetical protein